MQGGTAENQGSGRIAVVIEDDPDIRQLVALTLRSIGMSVCTATNSGDGVELVRTQEPDLVTLDLSLPDFDGFEACRRIRAFSDAFVLMLTARSTETDLLLGLETGADDYLSKPFSPRELAGRAHALLRRTERLGGAQDPVLRHGELSVDDGRRVVRLKDQELDLTKTEYDLLHALVGDPGRVWSKADLLARVWGSTWSGDAHLVETHMGNLRRKLGDDPRAARFVRTVRGVGYRMA